MKKNFDKRIADLRKGLEDKKTDCLLVFKDENIFYLTGFYTKDSGSILIVTDTELILLVHFINTENAIKSAQIPGINIVQFLSEKIKKLSEILCDKCVKNISVEGNNVSHELFINITGTMSKKGIKVKNHPGIVERLRVIKDEDEISLIRKSCSISLKAYKSISEMNYEEITSFSEKGLAFNIESRMLDMGSDDRSFDFVVAGNSSASLPHYEPTRKRIKGGLLLLDIGCRFNNYCSDLTRTFFIDHDIGRFKNNRMINKLIKVYDIVLQAQAETIKECRPGLTCRELDLVSRQYIEQAGYGKQYGHSVGHGVGLEIHELPAVSYSDNTVLEEGMVITIEPGIYLEGRGGVRIEDIVVVRKNNCENLYGDSKKVKIIMQ